MQFSPSLDCPPNGLAGWSPHGLLLAQAKHTRLILRDAASLKPLSSHACHDDVDDIVWSRDSAFVAAVVKKVGVVHVFATPSATSASAGQTPPAWQAVITVGAAGIEAAHFAPDSRHLIVREDFGVRLSIWSLVEKKVRYIHFPVCHAFSPDDADDVTPYLAVVERSNDSSSANECLCLYECGDEWRRVAKFGGRSTTGDSQGIRWSPNGDCLAVWSSPLECSVRVYSVPDGSSPFTYTGDQDGPQLGVRCVKWSPCGSLLFVGGYDETLKVFNALNWTLVTTWDHSLTCLDGIDHVTRTCDVFEERDVRSVEDVNGTDVDVDARIAQEWAAGAKGGRRDTNYQIVSARPVSLSRRPPDPRQPDPKVGVADVLISPGGVYLAARNEAIPNAVFVWDVQNLCLASLLMHQSPVASMSWEPGSGGSGSGPPTLLVLTRQSGSVFLWTPHGVLSTRVPSGEDVAGISAEEYFRPGRVLWNALGRTLCLVGRDRQSFVCAKIKTRKRLLEEAPPADRS